MYDIAIVGGGPAGISAAVNSRRRNKSVVVISKENYSSKLIQAPLIDNFPGIPKVSGRELAEKFKEHAEILGADFIKDEIQNIYPESGNYNLTGRENLITAKAVILAVGVALGAEIAGEADWIGRGVSYCATCDGMFFKNKVVAVIGYIMEAENELHFLADICAKVYYLPQYKAPGKLDPRVILVNEKPLAITGSAKVESLILSQGELPVDGVFIERSALPAAQLLAGLQTDQNLIICDSNQATNLAGVFAAGDCTGKPWQISRAVGQGQVAALSAVNYLDTLL